MPRPRFSDPLLEEAFNRLQDSIEDLLLPHAVHDAIRHLEDVLLSQEVQVLRGDED